MKRPDEDKTMFNMPGAQSTYRNLYYDRHLRSIAPGLLSFLTGEQQETVIKLLRTFDFLSQGSGDLDIKQVCRIYESSRTHD